MKDRIAETAKIAIGRLEDLDDPGCREFQIGDGDWPFRGFVVRQGNRVFAYQNFCVHAGHQLNWMTDSFLSRDRRAIQCASHGAMFEIDSGLCFRGPCVGKSLRAVDVELRDGQIFVIGPTSM